MKKQHADLWTRAIHLLHMEPKRSAETPNSFKDLKDILKSHTRQHSVIQSIQSHQTSRFGFFFLSTIAAGPEQTQEQGGGKKTLKKGGPCPPPQQLWGTAGLGVELKKPSKNLWFSRPGFRTPSPPPACWRWYRE